MLMEVVFVKTAGALGLGLAAPAAMLGAALALGLAEALGLGRADALARGVIDGEAEGRGAAGAGNTGGSTNGDSMRRSTVRAKPSDSARSSSTSVAPKVARRSRCVTFALSFENLAGVKRCDSQDRHPRMF